MDCSEEADRWCNRYRNTSAPLPCSTRLTTSYCILDDSLLVNKANKDILQPLYERINIAREFLELFKPGLEYYVVPITDVAGPTGWDPNVQAIVVSKETLNGAATSTSHFVIAHLEPKPLILTCADLPFFSSR